MSEIWPFDLKNKASNKSVNPIRPFKCLLLMPFENRFDTIAEVIKTTVLKALEDYDMNRVFGIELPNIQRLDWITSAGVIQEEIWQEILDADLVFCDITGYNPNVMFETGVSASWKETFQVVLIKDRFFKQQSAFDIAPIRYTEYELTSDGIAAFKEKIANLTLEVLIGFPDRQGYVQDITLPIEFNFQDNRDDLRIYTPPYAHRRIIDSALEIGSLRFYSHSWASIGKNRFSKFELDFTAQFRNPISDDAWIGVALRSQHYYANYSHLFYLNLKGLVVITEPNEVPPAFYEDNHLRPHAAIDNSGDHHFHVSFDDAELGVQVDDFTRTFQLKELPKVLGPGLIRFQSWQSWMAIKKIRLENRN